MGLRLRTVTLLVASAMAGCAVEHAVVVRDGAPLYAGPRDDRVIEHLPRYYHQELEDAPEDGGRVPLSYGGHDGWASRADVHLFEYRSPALDGGEDRDRVVRTQLRELLLAEQGRGWPPATVEAIRQERVIPGMTRPQVELAWGWPLTVEPLGTTPDAGERWVYRHAGTVPVRRWVDGPWLDGGLWFHPWGVGPGYGWHGGYDWRWNPTWVTVQLPVTVERVIEFDGAGRVVRVSRRRLLDEES